MYEGVHVDIRMPQSLTWQMHDMTYFVGAGLADYVLAAVARRPAAPPVCRRWKAGQGTF